MTSPQTRTTLQREADRKIIAELYCQAISQAEIAVRIHLSPRMVSYDIAVIQKRWIEATTIDLDAAKGRELAKIDNLERICWDAWQKSWDPKESTETGRDEPLVSVQEIGAKDNGHGRQHARIRKEGRLGNPEYLKGVQWCIEQRCQLLQLVKKTSIIVDNRQGIFVAKDFDYGEFERLYRAFVSHDSSKALIGGDNTPKPLDSSYSDAEAGVILDLTN